MFLDSLDALAHTITERWKREDRPLENQQTSVISNISVNVSRLQNGIKYCSVQIECEDGQAYFIQAAGDEAEELYGQASSYRDLVERERSRLQVIREILQE